LCEKTGTIALALLLNSEILKLYTQQNIRIFLAVDKGALFIYGKVYPKVGFGGA